MAYTAPLSTLILNLKFELGASSSPAAGINQQDQLIYMLNRAQEQIAIDFEWPLFTVDRDIPIVVGTRYYAYPTDLDYSSVERVWLVWNTLYGEMSYGIGPEQFALFNSNTGFTSWPVERWMHNADSGLFELWPVPSEAPPATPTSQAALIRMRGTKLYTTMVNPSDQSTFPATAIVLYAASEILMRAKDDSAQAKLAAGQAYIRRLKVRQNKKKQPFVLGGGHTGDDGRRIGIDYIPIGYGSGPGTG
jgi:hypothetical protein